MLPSSKLTWQWKMSIFNREYIFNRSIFHCHVSLPEGTQAKGSYLVNPMHYKLNLSQGSHAKKLSTKLPFFRRIPPNVTPSMARETGWHHVKKKARVILWHVFFSFFRWYGIQIPWQNWICAHHMHTSWCKMWFPTLGKTGGLCHSQSLETSWNYRIKTPPGFHTTRI